MGMACSLHDQFEAAATRGQMCRIVYQDTYGEHHAVLAVPKDWRVLDGVEWGFFESEGGADMEVRLSDIVAIEVQSD
ncbi:MAG: hypothetical protein ACE5F3_02760 [Mariprofundaceae bacterium]